MEEGFALDGSYHFKDNIYYIGMQLIFVIIICGNCIKKDNFPKKRQKIYEIITELCIWSEKLCYFMETCYKSTAAPSSVPLKLLNLVFSFNSFAILTKNQDIFAFKVYQNLFSFAFYGPV